MDVEEIRLLWQRYLNGGASAAESRAVLEALAENQALAGELVQCSFEQQGSTQRSALSFARKKTERS
jgi:hypothetical protein